MLSVSLVWKVTSDSMTFDPVIELLSLLSVREVKAALVCEAVNSKAFILKASLNTTMYHSSYSSDVSALHDQWREADSKEMTNWEVMLYC